MDEAAGKIGRLFRSRQKRKAGKDVKKTNVKAKPKPKATATAKGYNRGAEVDQEIGDEFKNPDAEMDQAAGKIGRMFRSRQKRKAANKPTPKAKAKVKPAAKPKGKGKGYDRDTEAGQEIGDEFKNPDAAMDQAAGKIGRMFRSRQKRKKGKAPKKKPKQQKAEPGYNRGAEVD